MLGFPDFRKPPVRRWMKRLFVATPAAPCICALLLVYRSVDEHPGCDDHACSRPGA